MTNKIRLTELAYLVNEMMSYAEAYDRDGTVDLDTLKRGHLYIELDGDAPEYMLVREAEWPPRVH